MCFTHKWMESKTMHDTKSMLQIKNQVREFGKIPENFSESVDFLGTLECAYFLTFRYWFMYALSTFVNGRCVHGHKQFI